MMPRAEYQEYLLCRAARSSLRRLIGLNVNNELGATTNSTETAGAVAALLPVIAERRARRPGVAHVARHGHGRVGATATELIDDIFSTAFCIFSREAWA